MDLLLIMSIFIFVMRVNFCFFSVEIIICSLNGQVH
jgi:hypothetical protein